MDNLPNRHDDAERKLDDVNLETEAEVERAQNLISETKEQAKRDWDNAYEGVETDANTAASSLEGEARRLRDNLEGSTDTARNEADNVSSDVHLRSDETVDDMHVRDDEHGSGYVRSDAEQVENPGENDKGLIDRIKDVFTGDQDN